MVNKITPTLALIICIIFLLCIIFAYVLCKVNENNHENFYSKRRRNNNNTKDEESLQIEEENTLSQLNEEQNEIMKEEDAQSNKNRRRRRRRSSYGKVSNAMKQNATSSVVSNAMKQNAGQLENYSTIKTDVKATTKTVIDNQVNNTLDKILDAQKEAERPVDYSYEDNDPIYFAKSFVIYQNSIYKIGRNGNIYRKYLNGGNWFKLTDKYTFGGFSLHSLKDITLITETTKNKLNENESVDEIYIYALYGNYLCKKPVDRPDEEWLLVRNFNDLGTVIRITNNKTHIIYNIDTEYNENNLNEVDYVGYKGRQGITMSGIYSKIATTNDETSNENTVIQNNNVGSYVDMPSNRAMNMYMGNVISVADCSSKCNTYKYFGVQGWDGNFSKCFCSNSLYLAQKYGASDVSCGRMGSINCNSVYERKILDVSVYLYSQKYKLICANNYSDSTEIYGLYDDEDSTIVVKKANKNVYQTKDDLVNNDEYDDVFDTQIDFVDLFLTDDYLYGLGMDGFVYRKSTNRDVVGDESIIWLKVTTNISSTERLKLSSNKKLSVHNGYIYVLFNNMIKKQKIMGHEWVSIDEHNTNNKYYTQSPKKIINTLNKKFIF